MTYEYWNHRTNDKMPELVLRAFYENPQVRACSPGLDDVRSWPTLDAFYRGTTSWYHFTWSLTRPTVHNPPVVDPVPFKLFVECGVELLEVFLPYSGRQPSYVHAVVAYARDLLARWPTFDEAGTDPTGIINQMTKCGEQAYEESQRSASLRSDSLSTERAIHQPIATAAQTFAKFAALVLKRNQDRTHTDSHMRPAWTFTYFLTKLNDTVSVLRSGGHRYTGTSFGQHFVRDFVTNKIPSDLVFAPFLAKVKAWEAEIEAAKAKAQAAAEAAKRAEEEAERRSRQRAEQQAAQQAEREAVEAARLAEAQLIEALYQQKHVAAEAARQADAARRAAEVARSGEASFPSLTWETNPTDSAQTLAFTAPAEGRAHLMAAARAVLEGRV